MPDRNPDAVEDTTDQPPPAIPTGQELPVPSQQQANALDNVATETPLLQPILTPNSKAMEIHPHGHVHETKKWKEYIFQFIMLFLAVSLSFFVENQREHYVEHQRAAILASSIVENLKADLIEVENVISTSDTMINWNNTLIAELNKPRPLQNDSLIHRNGLQNILRFNVYDPSMGNYEQVKYSGALRYFKPEIVSLLTSYETSTNYLLKIAQAYLNFRNDCLVPFCTQQTNPRFLFAITNNKPIPNPVFSQTPTQEKLDQIYRYALFVNSQMKHQINIVQDQQKKAAALIKVLKENYHLNE